MNKIFSILFTLVFSTSSFFILTGCKKSGSIFDSTFQPSASGTTSALVALSDLKLSVGSFSPVFNSNTLTYGKSVTCTSGATTVTPTTSDANATLKVRINGGSYQAVTSATASGALTLKGGMTNVIEILVTAADGVTTTTYKINVARDQAGTSCGLIGFWHLDDPLASTSAFDSSPNHYNLPSSSVTYGATGKIGSAITLNGTSSYLFDPSGPVINAGEVTVSAWINPSNYPVSGRARLAGFSQGNNGGTFDKVLSIDSNGFPEFYVYCDGQHVTFTGPPANPVPKNVWSHVVGVVDGINVYMYVNGVNVANTTCGSTYTGYNSSNLLIGGKQATDITNYFSGLIDEIGIWSRGLNDQEVSDLFTNGVP